MSDVAFDLANRGMRVVVVTSRLRYDDAAARLPERERVQGVEVRRVATTRFGRGGLAARAADLASFYVTAFMALLETVGPGDVIVAKTDPPLLSILGHAVARLKGARYVNWLQDVYPEVAAALGVPGLGGRVGRALAAWRDMTLRAAHANVVLGERMALKIRAAGVETARIRIISNWSDEGAVAPVPHEANDLRASWDLSGRFVVGYSGNLGRAHEWATMLGAAKALAGEPSIAFLMIGGGHQTRALKVEAERAGLTNLLFQPYQPREALAASLSAADIHWISLRPELEGLIVPSKAYGILAAGRPILAVTEADGEIARLVRDHGCGVQVHPGDHLRFAQVVRELAADPVRAQALGEAARRAATSVFSRAAALGQWRETLTAAAAGSSARQSRAGRGELRAT